MDRLPRTFVTLGLGLLLAGSGCRATRNEVPPGRPYAKDGQQRKAIEFSSDGHPLTGAATANFTPGGANAGGLAAGIGSSTSRPDGSAYGGAPGAYGGPGTSGLAQPGSFDPSTTPASGGSLGTPPTGVPPLAMPPPGASPAPDMGSSPRGEVQPMPSQTVIPPIDNPGAMGSPNQAPSPM